MSRLLTAFALATGLFGAGQAAAQNRCTLTSADIPSLSVPAGSANVVILDTADPTTLSTMNTLCPGGGMNNFGFEAASPSQDIANNNVITLPSGSTIKRTTAGTTRTLTYSTGPGVAGSETVSPFVAAAGFRDAGQTLSVAGRTVRFYPLGSAVGVYFTVVVNVTAPNAPTAAVTSLSPNPIYAGQSSTVTITLTNPNGVALAGVANAINLPANVIVAGTPGASTSCGGTLTATAGASTVTLSGGTLAANASCTLTFNVTSSVVAAYTISSGTPSATGANAGSAGTTATLTVSAAPAAPTISAAWDQANVAVGGNRTLTVTIANPNGSAQLTGVGFNFGTLDAALGGASPGTTCTGGTASYVGGSRQFSLSGGTLNASASCTVTLTVSSSTPGTYSFTTGTVFATGPVALTGATATTGNLTVWSPPTIAVTATSPITIGGTSTVQLSFANANGGSLTGVGTIVTLPANVVIAASPGIVNNCGGTVTAVAGSGTATVSGGTVTGGGSCTVSFDVTSSVAATYSIPTGTPTSTQGGNGVAGTPASLVVNGAVPVLSGFTAPPVAYNSTGNAIDVAAGTAPSGNPTAWNIAKTAGGSFGATAESANSPAGVVNVSINTGTGAVTYAAPTGYRGNDVFYVRATNGTGDSNVVAVTVPVGNPTLSISLTGSGIRGTALSGVSVVTTGGQSPYSCGTPSVAMPGGVTLNANCTITGTPTVAGSTSFQVNVTDSSTGTGPFTQQSPILILNIVPPAPTIASLAPGTGTTAGGTSVQINGTNFDPGQVTAVTWDGSSIAYSVDAGGTFITVTTPAHAAGAVNVSVTTTGGTTSSAVFTYVATPAAPVVTVPANGATIGGATPTYQGTSGSNLVVTVYVDGASIGTTTSSAGGTWSLAQPTALPDGLHSVRATATDNGVTSGFSSTNSFTVDAAAPAAPNLTAPANGSTTNDNTPTVTGTAEANATVTVSFDGTPSGTTVAAAGGAWSFTPVTPLADGAHNVSATATDGAGNISPPSNTNGFTVDTTPPTAPVTSLPANGSTTDATPTFSGTAEANATVTVIVDGASIGTTPADAGGNWSRVSAALAIGAHTVRATATDAAGNVSPNSNTNTFTVAAVPSITGLSPDQGALAGGNVVTITGANLTGATVVLFGASPATFTVDSATSITATAPAGSAGTVNVTVTTPAGTSATGPANQYTYVSGPTITAVSPGSGPITGGTAVILTGTGFTGATTVTFGGTPAIAFTVDSPTQISATAPSGSAGPAVVAVTTPGGIATGTYTYVAAPTVTALSPSSGSAAGGTSVSVTGTGFTGATSVTFGAAPATSFTVNSATSITATAPAGSGVVNVRVTTTGGTSAAAAGNAFTYVATPTVTALSPDTGPATGGTVVTLTGTNLTGATAVRFGATPASGFTVNSATSITATAPAGSGTVNVTVDTAGGTSAAAPGNQYLYIGAPMVTGIAPNQGPTSGGTAVTITGTGFTGATAVSFGASPASGFTVNSATSITATAPAGATGTVDVTVTTGGGTSATGAADRYTYVAAPIAGDRAFTVAYDTPTPIDLSTAISGGPHSSIAIASAPAHGTTSIAGDIVTYTPASGYFGADSFTYTATGPGGTSAPATVILTVSAPAAPVAADKPGVSVPYNSSGTAIDLSGSITGVHTSIAVATPPAHGTTSIAGDVVTYTPASGYFGADSFTYTATGPGGTSAPATVSLTVGTPPAPVAADKPGVTVPYDSSGTAIDLSGSITGIHTSIAVATAPAHGTTSVAGDVVTYTPTTGYGGPDSFTYTATGPGGTSAPATVSLTVSAPVVILTLATLPDAIEDSAYSVQLTASGGTAPYTYTRTAGTLPAGITLSTGGLIAGTPTENGSFTFTVTARDSSSGAGPFSGSKSYTLIVTAPPPPTVVDAPSTSVPASTIGQSQSVDINLSSLVSGNYDEIRIDTPPQHGTATLRHVAGAGAGQWIATYQPTIGFSGTDRFTFVAVGPGGTSSPASVTINVIGAVPEAPSLTASTIAGQEVTVDLTASARQGPFSGATIVSISPANSATATLVEGGTPTARTYQMRIRPDGRFSGATVVTYTLTNVFGTSAPATVTVTVTARPDPSQDPVVRGLVAAQADATKRFASAQLDNFNRRNEQLHDGGGASKGSPIGISLGGSDRQVLQRPGGRMEVPDAVAMKMEHTMATIGAERASGLLETGETNIGGPRRGAADGTILGGLRARGGATPQGRSGAQSGGDTGSMDAGTEGGRAKGSLAIWSGGAIQIGTRDATSGRARLSMTTSGLSAGADIKLSDGAIFGLGGGYGGQRTDIGEDEQARLTGRSWMGAAYGSVRPFDGTFIDGVAGIGGLDFSTRRIAANNQLATGSRDGTMRFGSLSLGMDRQGEKSVFSAYARAEYIAATLRAYSEGGAGLYNLKFAERDLTSFSSVIGFRGSIRIDTGMGILKPRARFEWRHEFENGSGQFLDYADLAGFTYRITDTGWLRDALSPELGIGLETNGWIFGADVTGQFGEGSRSATLRLSLGKEF
jgi:uncharacterized protein YhjY with autotransporter beta-barrel domain